MSVQLTRAIDILELLQAAEAPVSLSDIAERLDLPKSAAHRLLQVWIERGYVAQEPVGQRYEATLKLAIIGFTHLAATGIRDVCYPDLRRLATETGELVRLAVFDNDALTWIVEAQGSRSGLRYDGNLGRQALLHATAAGKAVLSTLSETEAVRLVIAQDRLGSEEAGPNAVATIGELLEMLRETRARGYATAFEEAALGVSSVAVPVFERQDSSVAVGAIIVVGPTARMNPQRIATVVPALKAAGARVSALWPIRKHVADDQEIALMSLVREAG